MPEKWLVFYAALDKIPKTKLIHPKSSKFVENDDHDDEDLLYEESEENSFEFNVSET